MGSHLQPSSHDHMTKRRVASSSSQRKHSFLVLYSGRLFIRELFVCSNMCLFSYASSQAQAKMKDHVACSPCWLAGSAPLGNALLNTYSSKV